MIAGETRTVRHTETGDSAFTFDDTPVLTVTYPDGTTDTPAVSVSPSTSALTQTLSATVAFQAGVNRLVWTMDVGAQNPITRIEQYFAAWSDVYTDIRGYLNRTLTQLTDAEIDPVLARIVRKLTRQFPCIGSYSDLTGEDRYAFDDALALFAAAELRPTLGSSAVAGEVKRKKQGDLEIEYSTTGSVTVAASQSELWITSAWESLRGVECIGWTTPLDKNRARVSMPVSIFSPPYESDCTEVEI